MVTLGIISDTHGLLRAGAAEHLSGLDLIIHAGDIGRPEVLSRLDEIAPTRAICGNIDKAAWAAELPDTLTLEIGSRTIHVLHDLKKLKCQASAEGFDVVISGHSHRPSVETRGGVLYLNPGSAGPPRFKLPVTLATLHIAEGAMRARIHRLDC